MSLDILSILIVENTQVITWALDTQTFNSYMNILSKKDVFFC